MCTLSLLSTFIYICFPLSRCPCPQVIMVTQCLPLHLSFTVSFSLFICSSFFEFSSRLLLLMLCCSFRCGLIAFLFLSFVSSFQSFYLLFLAASSQICKCIEDCVAISFCLLVFSTSKFPLRSPYFSCWDFPIFVNLSHSISAHVRSSSHSFIKTHMLQLSTEKDNVKEITSSPILCLNFS